MFAVTQAKCQTVYAYEQSHILLIFLPSIEMMEDNTGQTKSAKNIIGQSITCTKICNCQQRIV